MSAAETRALVERWVAALNAHDVTAIADLLHDEYEEVGPSETLHGKAAGVADAAASFRSQPDMECITIALVVQDETAAVEYSMNGTLVAPLRFADGRVVPATGRRYEMYGCSWLWIRNGRIAVVDHYWDRVLIREQLGLSD